MAIHSSALVDSGARLGVGVEVGPFAVVGDGVVIGDRCRIGAHASLLGPLSLGEECRVEQSVVLGGNPQVKGNDGPFGGVRIGARNGIREFTVVHRSTRPDGETVIGDDCFLMSVTHVAHDCRLGDRVTIASNSVLGGHVTIRSGAFLGGLCGVHQFSEIGELAMVAGGANVNQDVPPFCMAAGSRPFLLRGLNVIGLRRAGVSAEARSVLKKAFHVLFRSGAPIAESLGRVVTGTPEVDRLVEFVRSSKRGVPSALKP